jgi:transposase
MKRTPAEIRAAIVSRYRRGGVTHAALAAQFKVSKFTVGRILRDARERQPKENSRWSD